MKRLEIVHLRTSAPGLAMLGRQIDDSMAAEGGGGDHVTVYGRLGLETDVAIHIETRVGVKHDGPSAVGLRLADALKAHGLVEHTVWEELP
jgi:hypothetical protein